MTANVRRRASNRSARRKSFSTGIGPSTIPVWRPRLVSAYRAGAVQHPLLIEGWRCKGTLAV